MNVTRRGFLAALSFLPLLRPGPGPVPPTPPARPGPAAMVPQDAADLATARRLRAIGVIGSLPLVESSDYGLITFGAS